MAAAGTQAGCGREFYREWANQDVSEAVFEKSRDPRWRIDFFSIEPPAALARRRPLRPRPAPRAARRLRHRSDGPGPPMARQPADHRRRRHRLPRHARDWKQNRQPDKKKPGTPAAPPNPSPTPKRNSLRRRTPVGSRRSAQPGGTGRPPTQSPPPTPAENPTPGENSGPDDPTLSPNSLPTPTRRPCRRRLRRRGETDQGRGRFLTDDQITPNPATTRRPAPPARLNPPTDTTPAPGVRPRSSRPAFRSQSGSDRPNPSPTSRTNPAPTSRIRRSAWTQRRRHQTSPNRSTPGPTRPPRDSAPCEARRRTRPASLCPRRDRFRRGRGRRPAARNASRTS